MLRFLSKSSREEAEESACDAIEDSVWMVHRIKRPVIVAFPGGRSVAGVLDRLAERKLPWCDMHIFMVDERVVPLNHRNSNFRVVRRLADRLIEEGRIPEENIHPFIPDLGKRDFGAEEYGKEIESLGGSYDVVVLSAGEDCHVGSLFPNHQSIRSGAEYFVAMNDSPKPPSRRVSASRKLLSRANSSVLLFFGESKRGALEKFRSMEVDMYSCPAKIVHKARNPYVVTDIVIE